MSICVIFMEGPYVKRNPLTYVYWMKRYLGTATTFLLASFVRSREVVDGDCAVQSSARS